MKRRDFLKSAYKASALVGAGMVLGNFDSLLFSQNTDYDLVAVKGGEPDVMFDKAIEALGGMKKFVKKGQKVVVKPNIGWDTAPERAANTNPKLVGRIVEHCYNAGAREVYVVDHTCDEWQRCYKNSGIEKAAKDAKAKVVPANSESYYQEVSIPQGKVLKNTKEHEVILSSDVFINVPVLKNHGGATLTIAMKNLMGNVWDRRYWHRNDLHQCIADFATYRKPTLNIVDAYLVMKTNGPRGVSTDDVVLMKSQLLSTDIVAVDSAAAKLFGLKPEDIRYLNIATEMKIGRKDIENLNIKRITV
ncbi:MAG: Iron-sulfur cluster-binding protein [Ignavibacteriae bacterium]|nr:MAG: Iron-sulfur cluster-binding protein [Ignavibacteriota bacterium]